MLSRKALLIVAFVVAEFYVSAQAISAFGFGLVFLASIALSIIGFSFLRSGWRRAAAAPTSGGSATEIVSAVADGALRSLGAALLIIPGLISAVIGLALLAPPIRRLVSPLIAKRVEAAAPPQAMAGADMFNMWTSGVRRRDPDVVDVDVVDTTSANDGAPDSTQPNPADSARPELR